MGRFLLIIAMGTLFALIALEIIGGCGEPTYFQNHTWVTGECLFIPYGPVTGRW